MKKVKSDPNRVRKMQRREELKLIVAMACLAAAVAGFAVGVAVGHMF